MCESIIFVKQDTRHVYSMDTLYYTLVSCLSAWSLSCFICLLHRNVFNKNITIPQYRVYGFKGANIRKMPGALHVSTIKSEV